MFVAVVLLQQEGRQEGVGRIIRRCRLALEAAERLKLETALKRREVEKEKEQAAPREHTENELAEVELLLEDTFLYQPRGGFTSPPSLAVFYIVKTLVFLQKK